MLRKHKFDNFVVLLDVCDECSSEITEVCGDCIDTVCEPCHVKAYPEIVDSL